MAFVYWVPSVLRSDIEDTWAGMQCTAIQATKNMLVRSSYHLFKMEFRADLDFVVKELLGCGQIEAAVHTALGGLF